MRVNFLVQGFFQVLLEALLIFAVFSAGFKSGVPPGAIRSLLHAEA